MSRQALFYTTRSFSVSLQIAISSYARRRPFYYAACFTCVQPDLRVVLIHIAIYIYATHTVAACVIAVHRLFVFGLRERALEYFGSYATVAIFTIGTFERVCSIFRLYLSEVWNDFEFLLILLGNFQACILKLL